MSELFPILLLFIVGVVAGFLNVTAGGGSTLTVPALIFLGLDSAMANGTNRIAILLQNTAAVYSFKKENYQQFDLSLKLSLLTLPGAVAGALIAIHIDDQLFQKILGVIMIGIIISMIIPRKKLVLDNGENKKITIPVAFTMLCIGLYGGFIQVGVGFILMAAMKYLLKFDLIHVNMHKVFIVLIYTVPALIIFMYSGNINWTLGISLAAGNSLGGWWAVKASIKRGEGFIKSILIVAILIMALKLFNVF